MSRARVLALDFDGVIWDSAGECFEVACRAYQELFGTDMASPRHRQAFLGGRPLARTGHDFFIILRLLEQRPGIELLKFPLADFVTLRHELAEDAQRFHHLFYRLRSKYREENFDAWAAWQGPYPEVIRLLDRWEGAFEGTALATTKDAASAHALLQSAGRDWPIFGKEFSVEKNQQIEGIAQHYGVCPGEILFLDDLLENLQQVAPLGARTAMAAWGYNTPESRQQARELGFPVVDVEGFERLLEETVSAAPTGDCDEHLTAR